MTLSSADLDRAIGHLDRLIATIDRANTTVAVVKRDTKTDSTSSTWWKGPQGEDLRAELDTFVAHAGKALPAWHEANRALVALRTKAHDIRSDLTGLEEAYLDTYRLDPLALPDPDGSSPEADRRGLRSDIDGVEESWVLALRMAQPTLSGALDVIRTHQPEPTAVKFGNLPLPTGDVLDALLTERNGQIQSIDSVEAVESWFEHLSPEAAQAWAEGAPDLIGNTDGVPFEYRIEANRIAIQDLVDALPAGEPVPERLAQLLIDGTRTVDPSRQILVFDAEGDGKIAELIGDLDTASQIAVLVPGITSTMDNFQELVGSAIDFNRASPATALIAWTGYDTPSLSLDAANPAKGIVGGGLLASFLTGIGALHPQPLHLFGHSYGSFTAGQALLQGAQVDTVTFLGSPGTGVDHIDDFPEGAAKRYYAGEIDGDVVATFEHFGDAPTDPDFGATSIDVGTSDELDPTKRHTKYFDVGLNSLVTIAEGGTPAREQPRASEGLIELIDDATDGIHSGIDWGQQTFVTPNPILGPGLNAIIDIEQDKASLAEQGFGVLFETGENIVSSAIEQELAALGDELSDVRDDAVDLATGVGGTLVDGVSGLGDSFRSFGLRH